MKISVDIDLSPSEARELLGWPDMTKVHETTIAMFTDQLKNGNQEAMMNLLKPYLDGSQQAFSFYQKMMEGIATTTTTGKK